MSLDLHFNRPVNRSEAGVVRALTQLTFGRIVVLVVVVLIDVVLAVVVLVDVVLAVVLLVVVGRAVVVVLLGGLVLPVNFNEI